MKKLFYILYISLFLLMITACSDVGIFYALEIEEVIADNNNLNDKARFSTIVDTDTSSATGYYIGNAGPTVYYRSKVGAFSSWSKLDVPTTGYASDATTSSMVMIGADLYISRISHDGSNVYSGIYRLTGAVAQIEGDGVQEGDWTTTGTITTNSGSDDSYKFYKLFEANGNLYVNETSRNDDDDFNITDSTVYLSTAPTTDGYPYTDITANLSITTTEEVIDAAYDGANYWLIYNKVTSKAGYTIFDDVANFTTTPTLSSKDAMVVDMFYYTDTDIASDYVLISNLNNDIYVYQVGTGWNGDINNSVDFIYRGFADIDDLSANTVIVGTSAYGSESPDGYYQINMSTLTIESDDDNFFSDKSNYSSSKLSDASIVGFLMDSQNDRLFAYTEDEGVWLNISTKWSLE